MFDVFKLTGYHSPTKWLQSSRAPFEPTEKRTFEQEFIYFVPEIDISLKAELFICFIVHMKRASNQVGER